jgi:hypothetical protein
MKFSDWIRNKLGDATHTEIIEQLHEHEIKTQNMELRVRRLEIEVGIFKPRKNLREVGEK